MNYKIEIKESAAKDVIDAFVYYEKKQHVLGERFLKCWENQLLSLQKKPLLYQKKYKDFRQVLLKPFPYHVIYEIQSKIIIVYKVSYCGRHPRIRYTKK